MVRTREFFRKVQNEDFQSRLSNKVFKKAQAKGLSGRSKDIFEKGGSKNWFGVQIKYWL
jgi:hypothetical protein